MVNGGVHSPTPLMTIAMLSSYSLKVARSGRLVPVDRGRSKRDAETLTIPVVVFLIAEIAAHPDPLFVADLGSAVGESDRIGADRPAQPIVIGGDRVEDRAGDLIGLCCNFESCSKELAVASHDRLIRR